MVAGEYFRRGFAEFVGVFVLVFVAAGERAFASVPTDLALAYGLAVAVMVTATAAISGGHINPAVTLGFVITRRIQPLVAVWYWIAQFGGAALAALLLKWVLPHTAQSQGHLGVPVLGTGVSAGKGVVVEAVLTFFLVWVVFATIVDARSAFEQVAGLAIGLTVVFNVLMAYGLTGAAMNPARAFGPQLVGDHWAHCWVWYVGPFAGAVIAAALYEMLYLRPGQDELVVVEAAAVVVEPLDDEATPS